MRKQEKCSASLLWPAMATGSKDSVAAWSWPAQAMRDGVQQTAFRPALGTGLMTGVALLFASAFSKAADKPQPPRTRWPD